MLDPIGNTFYSSYLGRINEGSGESYEYGGNTYGPYSFNENQQVGTGIAMGVNELVVYIVGYNGGTSMKDPNDYESPADLWNVSNAFVANLKLGPRDGLTRGPISLLLSDLHAYGRQGGSEQANGVVLDSSDTPHVVGYTTSTDFPGLSSSLLGGSDAFILHVDGNWIADYTRLFGGSRDDNGTAIARDVSGNLNIAGSTMSTDLPTSSGAHQETFGGGCDGFVARFDATGMFMDYATILGGAGHESVNGIAIDYDWNAAIPLKSPLVTVIGWSEGDTPGVSGPYVGMIDAFFAQLAVDGSSLVRSGYLGGSTRDLGRAIATNGQSHGGLYLAGGTVSNDFPTTGNALQPTFSGGGIDAFVARYDS